MDGLDPTQAWGDMRNLVTKWNIWGYSWWSSTGARGSNSRWSVSYNSLSRPPGGENRERDCEF